MWEIKEPAFPCTCPSGDVFCGMTLRDWFAGQALAGEMASQNGSNGEFTGTTPDEVLLSRAKLMYRFADAMLEAR